MEGKLRFVKPIAFGSGLVLLLASCATIPTGPTVLVLPGSTKSFEQFKADDGTCRDWASAQAGGEPARVAGQSAATGALVGTAVGATAGAVLGAASGRAGPGAAIGAGVGLLGGSAAGADVGRVAATSVQRRYDNAYVQCMFAKGNRVPVARGAYGTEIAGVGSASRGGPKRSASDAAIPPPPPGAPPSPPPGASP